MIGSILRKVHRYIKKTLKLEDVEKEDRAPAPVEIKQENEQPTLETGRTIPFSRPQRQAPPQEGSRRRSRPQRKRRPAAATPPPGAEARDVPPWDPGRFQVPPVEGKARFHDFDLPPEIMHAISDMGFLYCTPIQAAMLPHTLQGKDATGRAQTGTGKTAVFALTILMHLFRKQDKIRDRGTPTALVLAPTRELALQIEKETGLLGKYTPFKVAALFGGMDYEKQRRQLSGQVDIVVATPGRLLDFKRQGDLHLSKVEILVIDEADRMLDMGFIPDVQRIIHYTPQKVRRQTMLFSATLTSEVTRFASQWTKDPVTVEIEPEQIEVDSVNQLVYITTIEEKFSLLYNMITQQNLERAIVFTNRRDQARRLTEQLGRRGINCALLSGEIEQRKRVKTLDEFKAGKIRVLVATDVAARGLHVEAVSHVFNYHLPLDPEDYVHRIGRTGRAGASGISVSFASEDDCFQIPAIEKYLGHEIRCEHPDDELLTPPPPAEAPPPAEHYRQPHARPQRRTAKSR